MVTDPAGDAPGTRWAPARLRRTAVSALRTVLIEKGYFTDSELEAKMTEIRRRFDVPDEMQSPVKQKARR